MPTNEELMAQLEELKTSLATTNRKLKEVEDFAQTHIGLDWGTSGIHSPHPNISVDTAEYGGGVMRIDDNGIQVVADSEDVTAIYWVQALSQSPGTEDQRAQISAQLNGTSVNMSLVAQRTSGSIVQFYMTESAATGAVAQLIGTGSMALQLFPAGDPPTPADGYIWYNDADNKLYAHINGVTVALGGGGSSMPMPPVVGPFSDVALGTELAASAAAAPAAAVWPTANLAIAYPFRVTEDSTAYKLWYGGSTAASGNIDVAIYDSAFSKVISTGTQVHAAATTVIDVANTALTAGVYYLAVSIDNTTAQLQRYATALRGFGMVQMAAAFVLPTTFVPAAIANVYVPNAGVILRSGFDI
jgi:hypothetical protein